MGIKRCGNSNISYLTLYLFLSDLLFTSKKDGDKPILSLHFKSTGLFYNGYTILEVSFSLGVWAE